MLVAESSLAQAQAEASIITKESAIIISNCCQIDFIDIEKLKKDIKLGGNAAIPLVQQLTKVVKSRDFEASKFVHFGATSQDIVDTGSILQIAQFVNLFTFILLPAAILGIPGQVIAMVTPVHFFLQFWYHTVHIGKLGFLEKIIVTPSHHRVHHAINPIYLDKNHGQIFIIWDKLFGTFQEELDEVPPVYGITRPMKTWNPIRINFKHLTLLIQDAIHTKSWKNKLIIWFKPTGWRPEDVKEKYPVEKIKDPYQFVKYETSSSPLLMVWLCFQVIITLIFMYHLFANLADIGKPHIFIYGGFLILQIFAYSELMDGSKQAFGWDFLKLMAGILILFYFTDWFSATGIYASLVFVYLLLSAGVTYYFTFLDKNRLLVKVSEA
jgi:hypothetical protein